MARRQIVGLLALAGVWVNFASAEDKPAKSASAVKIVARNFDNPCGVAVQPETGHVFVAGNKQVVRLVKNEKKFDRFTEITGYPVDVYGKGPMYDIGALGLTFLSPNLLAVGDGGLKDGSELVRFFEVGATPAGKGMAQKYDAAKYTSGPIAPGEASQKGEGNLYALAFNGKAVFVTCNGDDTKGWIAKIDITDGKPGELKPFIATKGPLNVDAPTGIIMGPSGELVVSQMGEINVPGDSLLTAYDAETGKLLKKAPTKLNDIVALAISPKTKKLYGLDYSWMAADKGGLYLLEPVGEECKTTLVATIDKPTAMAFNADGDLYITAIGTATPPKEGKKPIKPGILLTASGL